MKRLAAELGWPTLSAALALCIAGLYPIDNPDTFGHLAAGREIAQLGHVPKLDSFSYFRPEPALWVNYEWLSDRLFYSAYRAGGYPALTALKLALLALLAGLLIAIARGLAGQLGAGLCALLIISDLPGLRFRLSVRPHLFGLVFGALYVLGLLRILERPSQRSAGRWVLGLAVAHVAWVNIHGSHLLGLALTGIACLCAVRRPSARRPLGALFALLLLASCVSPYGPAITSSALAHAFDPAYRQVIEEWQAWRPPQPIAYPLVLVWQALWFVVALRGLAAGPLRSFAAATTLLLFCMAARSLRFIPDCLTLSAPFVAAGLAPRIGHWTPTKPWLWFTSAGVALSGAAGLLCLQLPPKTAFGWGESLRQRPAASAAWLRQHLPDARILAVMPDAWDLMFSLPRAKFLIDGRTPFYGPAHVRHVQRAWGSARALRELLDSTGTDVVVAQPMVSEQQPALRALLGYEDFRLVMIEDRHCVFAKRSERRSQLLASRALHWLRPGYAADWLLAANADPVAITRELDRLGQHPNVQAYRAWVLGMLAARPLARAEGRAGLAAPRSPEQQASVVRALALVRAADATLDGVPSVSAYHALLATAACQLDEARAVLTRAAADGNARELALGAEELALRDGHAAQVRAFLTQARALPAAVGDAWLAALQTALESAPPCATTQQQPSREQ
jgi:hypothetical protein